MVTNIACVRSKRNGQDLPMFFVEIKTNINNKTIYKINRLLNSVVTIEPPRSQMAIPQCERCQNYGHTKKYCHRTPRCVKCTECHETKNCPRQKDIKDDSVKCVNCNGNHPANYKGCVVYQQLKRSVYPALRKKEILSTESSTHDATVRDNISFADVLKQNPKQPKELPVQNPDMLELKDMMKQLMQQMTTMLNLLTTVISKMK